MSWSMAGNTIALTKLLPPNSLSQQSPGAIATTTIVTRRRKPSPCHLPPPSLSRALFDCCVVVVVVDGDGGREQTPLSEARWGGIRCAVVWSPAVNVASSQDPTSSSCSWQCEFWLKFWFVIQKKHVLVDKFWEAPGVPNHRL